MKLVWRGRRARFCCLFIFRMLLSDGLFPFGATLDLFTPTSSITTARMVNGLIGPLKGHLNCSSVVVGLHGRRVTSGVTFREIRLVLVGEGVEEEKVRFRARRFTYL